MELPWEPWSPHHPLASTALAAKQCSKHPKALDREASREQGASRLSPPAAAAPPPPLG